MSSKKSCKDIPGLLVFTEDKDEVLILSPKDADVVLRMLQENTDQQPLWLSDSRVLLCSTASYGIRNHPEAEQLRTHLLEPRRYVGLLVSPTLYRLLLDIVIECGEPTWKVSVRKSTEGWVNFTIISNDTDRFIRTSIHRVLEVL